jgi:predicted ester cyclase
MGKVENNRRLVLKFYKAINGKVITKELLANFITDPILTDHLLFLDELFPRFSLTPEEITTEQDRVIVRAKLTGKHTGKVEGIEPTQEIVNTVFAIGYRIENKKIIDHWFISDQMELIQQLDLTSLFEKR